MSDDERERLRRIGVVDDSGGGWVSVFVDRDLVEYPAEETVVYVLAPEAPWRCDWTPDDLNPGPECPYCAGQMCARFDGLGCTHNLIERHGYALSGSGSASSPSDGPAETAAGAVEAAVWNIDAGGVPRSSEWWDGYRIATELAVTKEAIEKTTADARVILGELRESIGMGEPEDDRDRANNMTASAVIDPEPKAPEPQQPISEAPEGSPYASEPQTPNAEDEALFAVIRTDPTITMAAAERSVGLAQSRGIQRMKLQRKSEPTRHGASGTRTT